MASVRKRPWRSGGTVKTAWICDYKDQTGKRRTKTFKLKKNADAYLVRVGGEISQGIHTPESTSVTVAEACEAWLDRAKAEGLEKSTQHVYRGLVECHVLPVLSRVKLARLSTPQIRLFKNALLNGDMPDGKRRSRYMATKAVGALKGILGHAQEIGLVAYNAATPVKFGKRDRHEERVTPPSKEHVRAIIAAATPEWRPLIVTAAFTGLRISELLGLGWANVDLKAGVIKVTQRADMFRKIGSPKSKAAHRDVPLMPVVTNTLREWQVKSPAGCELVFPGLNGGVMPYAYAYRYGFKATQRRAGVVDQDDKPLYTIHAFRHFAVSILIEAGFAPKRIQEIIGHGSITLTYDRYGHWFPKPEDDQARLKAAQLSVLGS